MQLIMLYALKYMYQRFKIIDFLLGPWDPWSMILMVQRALVMGAIIDVFITWKFWDVSPKRR